MATNGRVDSGYKEADVSARTRRVCGLGPWGRGFRFYVLVVGLVAASTALRFALDGLFGPDLPFVTYYPAVAVAALVGGARAGLTATALSGLGAAILFMEPRGHLSVAPNNLVALGLFTTTGALVSWMAERLDRARRREAAAAERKRGEEALRAVSAELQRTLETSSTGLTHCSRDLRYLSANSAYAKLVGLPLEKIVGRPITEVMGAEGMEAIRPYVERVLRGERLEYEDEVPFAASGRRWLHVSYTPDEDASGKVVGWVASVMDITERKNSERALRESEARLRILVTGSFEGIAITENGRFVDLNEQLAQMLGYAREELLGTEVAAVVAPEDRARVLENIVAGRESLIEHEMVGKNGRRVTVEAHGRPVKVEGRWMRFTALRDITERKSAEEALRRKNERLHLLSESAERLLSTQAPEASVRELFQKLAEQVGVDVYFNYLVDDAGETMRLDSSGGLSEEEAQRIRYLEMGQTVCGAVAQERRAIEVKNAQHLEDVTTQLIRSLGIQACVCFPLLAGDHLLGTLSFGSRQRKEFSPEEVELLHTVSCYVAVAQEHAYGRRNLERMVQERTAELRDMVGELEHLSYTITHDMRAPLRAMSSFAEIASKICGDNVPKAARDALSKISISAERLDGLIVDALDYSRSVRQELPLTEVDTGALLRGMLDSYPELQPSRARVRVEGKLPLVLGNEAGLTQCMSNLLGNAVKFVRPGEKPEIRVWSEKRDGRARIWVEDNGIGISKEMLPRVFDLFSRGSRSYEGTGVGLALVRKVIQRMGGSAGVESEEGKGSRFWIELRLAEKRSTPIRPESAQLAPTGGTVLYVEDEESDAMFMRMAFASHGMESGLRVVNDGRAAIKYLSGEGQYADRDKFPLPSVVLLDLNLPQVSGFEVLKWMRNRSNFAGIPVVVFSSSTREDDRLKALALGANEFVCKPSSGLKFDEVVEELRERWMGVAVGHHARKAA